MFGVKLAVPSFKELDIRVVPWDAIWPEVKPLTLAAWEEAPETDKIKRPYDFNEPMFRKMCEMGYMLVIAIRHHDKLIGYLTWTIAPDAESTGLLVANQGPMYVEPGHAKLAVGSKMYKFSIEMLKLRGVKAIYFHHKMIGRGVGLMHLFKRLGARPYKVEYVMEIGDA